MAKKILSVLCSFCIYSCVLGIPVADFFQAITVRNCGKSIFPPSSPDRIIGGKYAKHGQYPWIVSIYEDGGNGFEHVCGASVLNENWVITAAHCIIYKSRPWKYQVLVGLHKLSRDNAATVQRITVSKMILHAEYDDDTSENDIALLKTVKPIDIAGSGGYVNGICLPTTNNDPTGYAKVIGWGHTKEDGKNSDTLKEVVVPMIPRDLCNDAYDDDPYDGFDDVTDTMICAGMTNRDSCQNDSGGPLFQTNSKGVATLIGIVSFGTGCGSKFYPGVYTKVSEYRNWIQKSISS